MSSSYHLVPASEGAQGMGGRAAAAPATWAGSESPWRRRGTFPFAAGCALTVLLSLLAGPVPVTARGGNQYAVLDEVPVVVNKVGPYHNPSETYHYYSLPFCRDAATEKKERQRMGETLTGDRRVVASNFEINFMVPIAWRSLCTKSLMPEEISQFVEAIEDQFYFEMFIDDLPMWGSVGRVQGNDFHLAQLKQFETSPRSVLLFTHLKFSIGVNGDQIVSANVTTPVKEMEVDLTNLSEPTQVQFSYSVEWVREGTKYEDRMNRYMDSHFLPSTFEIHWLSIINSFVLVLLLTAFLSIIMMRVLKNDFSRYMEVDEEDLGEEETGWKLIHGDVFRFPKKLNTFCAINGAGAQLCLSSLMLLICAMMGLFKATRRGSLLTAFIGLYVATSFVAGFVSGSLYRQLGGRNWVWNTMTASVIFPAPLFAVFCVVNTIAWTYHSTAGLPVFTVAAIGLMWLVVSFPMTVIGAIVGRNLSSDFETPCRTTKVPREIPRDIPWFRRGAAQMLISGFLPFSAIYIELHYIFAAVWGHKIYTLFGILLLAFVLLLIVTSFTTVALTYFQLACEDYRWWWRSFFCGGSSGIFIFIYSFYFYFQRSSMEGLLQASYFFGYMGMISFAFCLSLGYVGFFSSLYFVKHIYSVIKSD